MKMTFGLQLAALTLYVTQLGCGTTSLTGDGTTKRSSENQTAQGTDGADDGGDVDETMDAGTNDTTAPGDGSCLGYENELVSVLAEYVDLGQFKSCSVDSDCATVSKRLECGETGCRRSCVESVNGDFVAAYDQFKSDDRHLSMGKRIVDEDVCGLAVPECVQAQFDKPSRCVAGRCTL